jgi:hypothetical protein
MKKVAYLFTIVIAITLMSFSCEKEDPIVPTLEEQYSDWSNLTWVSTDGVTAQMNPDVYPRLEISISGDLVTVTKKITVSTAIIGKYTQADISGNTAIFTDVYEDYNGTGSTLTCTNVNVGSTQITLTCLGNTYTLQIN